jgi:hypothetical protein
MREPQQVCLQLGCPFIPAFLGQGQNSFKSAGAPREKNIFIHVHRFLLVSLVSLSMKPLDVVHSI